MVMVDMVRSCYEDKVKCRSNNLVVLIELYIDGTKINIEKRMRIFSEKKILYNKFNFIQMVSLKIRFYRLMDSSIFTESIIDLRNETLN